MSSRAILTHEIAVVVENKIKAIGKLHFIVSGILGDFVDSQADEIIGYISCYRIGDNPCWDGHTSGSIDVDPFSVGIE